MVLDDLEPVLREDFEDTAHALTESKLKLSNAEKLGFYAHYKQVTVGPCNTKKPGMFDFTGGAKWKEWHALGDMDAVAAAEWYVAEYKRLSNEDPAARRQATKGESMGGVFSQPTRPETKQEDMDVLFYLRDADFDNFNRLLAEDAAGVLAFREDETKMTALHVAADSGYLPELKALIEKGADVDAQDSDGCTALHFACVCEHEDIAMALVAAGCRMDITDAEGQTALDDAPEGLRAALKEMKKKKDEAK